MTTLMVRDNATHRPLEAPHKGLSTEIATADASHSGHVTIARREHLFAAIRLSRSLAALDTSEPGAVIDFPATIVLDGMVHDLDATACPGFFADGHHMVVVKAQIGRLMVSGRFELVVGESYGVTPASWTAIDQGTGLRSNVPEGIIAALPTSVHVPSLPTLTGAVRRAHLAAERARGELLETNRGLVRSVVNRFRGVLRAESASIDLGDLMAVAEHHLLEVVDRWFTDPTIRPVRDVAWSKLVQRAIGNALRTEIARATGISVEFRQLLAWFHSHPQDRVEPAAAVAERMAVAAGVTRVMARLGIQDRAAGSAALEAMLASGEAVYVAPGREAAATSRRMRTEGTFVIASRSSLSEIERAQRFTGTATAVLDGEDGQQERASLSMCDEGFDRADGIDMIRRLIEGSGMTPVEAMVWLKRTGALDPGGHGTELPDIATDLGLQGRAEARAALRRARRKLDAWTSQNFFAESLNG
ncbi:MAG: hypothetical protein QOJ74_284 [Ilumatobacteraceae bacterium]|nr:hypothetical protein [Ilumatobacteraceae bacterium]